MDDRKSGRRLAVGVDNSVISPPTTGLPTAMVSFAQNAEDVVLQRVFAGVQKGFYVDVGASAPVEDSVTLHFYEQGWSGVNVEPDPRDYDELCKKRKRDVNLNAAVDVGNGEVTFYPSETRGHGTLDSRVGESQSEIPSIRVASITLDRIFAEHAPAAGVEFLKIDVEGWEAQVLASADWKAVRPRVVLVEAVDADGNPTHEGWEGMLLAASYRFGLFDGLNRFYCREEDVAELLPRLGAPANVLDNWRPAREVRNEATLEARLIKAEEARASASAEFEAEVKAHADTRAALAAVEAAHADSRAALAAVEAAHTETRAALAAEQAMHANTRGTLAEVLASRSWRVTAPLRDLRRIAKVMRRGSAS